ncbi:MFS transporter [Streptacidiphilus monticola]
MTLRQAVLAVVFGLLAFGFSESVVFAVIDQGLHRPPAFLGVISSLEGVGAIAAGAVAGRLMRRIGESRLIASGLTAAGLGFAAGCVGSVWVVGVGVTLIGASLPWIIAGLMTLFQRSTPPELMGRTDAALGVMLSVPQTTAIALGAGLVAVVDFRLLLTAMAALMALGALYLFTRRPAAEAVTVEAPAEAAQAA